MKDFYEIGTAVFISKQQNAFLPYKYIHIITTNNSAGGPEQYERVCEIQNSVCSPNTSNGFATRFCMAMKNLYTEIDSFYKENSHKSANEIKSAGPSDKTLGVIILNIKLNEKCNLLLCK